MGSLKPRLKVYLFFIVQLSSAGSARSGSPSIRKFGNLCIEEILVLRKSSVRSTSAGNNKENCQTAKLKTSVAFTYFLYYTDPSLKIKLCVSQHVNDNEKIKIKDKLKRLLNPTEVIRTANQILTLREETEDN